MSTSEKFAAALLVVLVIALAINQSFVGGWFVTLPLGFVLGLSVLFFAMIAGYLLRDIIF